MKRIVIQFFTCLVFMVVIQPVQAQNHGIELFSSPQYGFYPKVYCTGISNIQGVYYKLEVNHFILKAGVAYNEINTRMEDIVLFEFTDYYLITHYDVERAIKKQDYMAIPIRLTYDYFHKSDFDIGVMLGVNLKHLLREELFYSFGGDYYDGIKSNLSETDFMNRSYVDLVAGVYVNYRFPNNIGLSFSPFYSCSFGLGEKIRENIKYMTCGLELGINYTFTNKKHNK